MVILKEGVQVTDSPAGAVILAALKQVSKDLNLHLVVTSGSDGEHSGPEDPHKKGNAYDVRSHDIEPDFRRKILGAINTELGSCFFGFLEDENTSNEHYHFQLRKGTHWDIFRYLES
jgi:hypothetical protein